MKDIIIEGVDRLGKDSLIDNIQHKLGFFQELHYQKPKLLAAFIDEKPNELVDRPKALKKYQEASFNQMFMMLSQPGRYLLNRAHLGEYVYSPRYRQYDGSYVFDLENRFANDHGSSFADTTLLVLLVTSDFSFIQDDGLSLDFSKKEEEQEDFKRAFDRSIIKNKIMIDVARDGFFKSKIEVAAEVVGAYSDLQNFR